MIVGYDIFPPKKRVKKGKSNKRDIENLKKDAQKKKKIHRESNEKGSTITVRQASDLI